ncbi:MAG: hypothetical protein Q8P27_01240 [Candidatus Peregrinibacteria bacterium]|nr:hypothetical protein [Candidatus Peregrinibacteria bacterium]
MTDVLDPARLREAISAERVEIVAQCQAKLGKQPFIPVPNQGPNGIARKAVPNPEGAPGETIWVDDPVQLYERRITGEHGGAIVTIWERKLSNSGAEGNPVFRGRPGKQIQETFIYIQITDPSNGETTRFDLSEENTRLMMRGGQCGRFEDINVDLTDETPENLNTVAGTLARLKPIIQGCNSNLTLSLLKKY